MKRILALILVIGLMVGTLAGCKKDTPADNGSQTSGSNSTGTQVSSNTTRPDSHVTLKMYLEGSNVTDDSKVLEKVNEYLDEKLNVTLQPIWGTWGDFD
ncbi:MAG: hypothetical protein K6E62_04915, partial [Lachnospiraceae bacterium]|nr:hypothetical protein [Lachnospiraceae bacterium]